VPLTGLCDVAEEPIFANALTAAGHVINARSDMEQLGFFVCDTDLEDELIRGIGTADVVQVIDALDGRRKGAGLEPLPLRDRRVL
jgi:hypothetical protein